MRGAGWRWVLAAVITLASAVWQRATGPSYPVRGTVRLGGSELALRLERSHGGEGGQPVSVAAPDAAIAGEVAWRHFPSSEPWTVVAMRREGDRLIAELPHQPPAGKLEYQVRLRRGADSAVFPARPAVIRFRGDVPALILVPHILAMFVAMLLSNRAGLEALAGGGSQRRLAVVTFVLLLVGGHMLGPAVQEYAFGAWWTGVPFGWDLTDNKTLLALMAWAWAVWAGRRGRPARLPIVAAALVTIVVFAIPHSVWGSARAPARSAGPTHSSTGGESV